MGIHPTLSLQGKGEGGQQVPGSLGSWRQAVSQAIGMLGLGLMGTAMYGNLLSRGFHVIGYDVLPEKVAALEAAGGRGAASNAAVAKQVDLVISSLPHGGIVEAAMLGPRGVAEGGRAGLTVIETSTVAPELARRVAAGLRERGIAMLDATVSGISHMVARRDCIFMVGGDRAVFDRCQPIWDALARRAYYLGESGSGAMMKLVANLITGLNSVATAEGLALGLKAGLDPVHMREILMDSAAASRMVDIRGQFMVERRYTPPVGSIEIFMKDADLMLEAGRRLGLPLPLTETMQRIFQATQADGHGQHEVASVFETYLRPGGVA
jgi:3-hydroxyisobutyrate dehydrogenase-like beta-hydroxyacid dehydrogenase